MRVVSTGLRRWSKTRKLTSNGRIALAIGVAAVALSGCMTLGDKTAPPDTEPPPGGSVAEAASPPQQQPFVAPPPEPAPPIKKVSRVKPASRPPAQDKVASIDPDSLIGMEPRDVRRLLGRPVQTRTDRLPHEWVYGTGRCSFRVFFYPNLNTAAFRVLKYGSSDGNGESIDASDVCIRHILMARKNAAD